jgi:hypothetical protein
MRTRAASGLRADGRAHSLQEPRTEVEVRVARVANDRSRTSTALLTLRATSDYSFLVLAHSVSGGSVWPNQLQPDE